MTNKSQADTQTKQLRDKAARALRLAALLTRPGGPVRLAYDISRANKRLKAQAGSQPATQTIKRARAPAQSQAQQPAAGGWLHSPLTKAVAGAAAEHVGRRAGVARGAWHTVRELPEDAIFLHRILNPLDPLLSPPGESASAQLAAGVVDLAQKGWNTLSDPASAVERGREAVNRWNRDLNPMASPQADTLGEEMQRRFRIAANQGQVAYEVGSAAVGGAELKALRGTRLLSRAPTVDDYLKRNVPRHLAEYFAETYSGRGHHYWPKRLRLPEIFGGGPLPPALAESPFFLLKPRDLTNGEFYELHSKVDPHVHGGRVPKRHGGGGWSRKKLGWQKYGPLGQVYYGAPGPLKLAVGGGLMAVTAPMGAAVDHWTPEEEYR